MSRHVHAWMLVGAVALIAAAGCAPQEPSPQPKVLTCEAKGYTLTFPPEWQTWDQGGRGTDLEGYPTDQPTSGDFRDMLFTYGEALPDSAVTLDDYANLKSTLAQQGIPGYTELESAEVDLGGATARRIVYTATLNGVPAKSVLYLLAKDRTGYMIAGTAAVERFDARLPEFEKIAASFAFTAAPESPQNP